MHSQRLNRIIIIQKVISHVQQSMQAMRIPGSQLYGDTGLFFGMIKIILRLQK